MERGEPAEVALAREMPLISRPCSSSKISSASW